MTIFSLEYLVSYAKKHSVFYQNLYCKLDEKFKLTDLPIIDQTKFWAANSVQESQVLTGPLNDAVVFRSGGTTGSPKFSVFETSEWEAFTQIFGQGMSQRALVDGDRIANIFHAGEMYASFLFINNSIERSSRNVVNFPLVGTSSFSFLHQTIVDFNIGVLAGVPTAIMAYIESLEKAGLRSPLKKILFGGEALYPDQREKIRSVFPNIEIVSIGYASVDAGLLGFSDHSCQEHEHRSFGDATIFEIVDEDANTPITEEGREGRVLITNLTRRLMPIIRYPAGDRAVWSEPVGTPHRKFKLVGRADEAARIGPVSLYYEDVRKILLSMENDFPLEALQIVLRHFEGRDQLVLKIHSKLGRKIALDQKIIENIYRERPLLADFVKAGRAHVPQIEWIDELAQLTNPRTGKLKRIVDERLAQQRK